MRILITAGGTREYIDPVRFITNASTGKMGECLAVSALKANHEVCLITTVEHNRLPDTVDVVNVVSAGEMFQEVKARFHDCDCLIMAAAVSDYTVANRSQKKIKKTGEDLLLKLSPTQDILKWAGKNKSNQFLAGFALEDADLKSRAEEKLFNKKADMIIANDPAAIGADKSSVHIKLKNSGWQTLENSDKQKTADRIIEIIGEQTC